MKPYTFSSYWPRSDSRKKEQEVQASSFFSSPVGGEEKQGFESWEAPFLFPQMGKDYGTGFPGIMKRRS